MKFKLAALSLYGLHDERVACTLEGSCYLLCATMSHPLQLAIETRQQQAQQQRLRSAPVAVPEWLEQHLYISGPALPQAT